MAFDAKIIINGHELSVGQSMTLRVACSAYLMEMVESAHYALGEDGDGRDSYLKFGLQLIEVLRIIDDQTGARNDGKTMDCGTPTIRAAAD